MMAHEAKKSGWFTPATVQNGFRASILGRVYLTDSEQTARVDELCNLFGISRSTASLARERGWFEVNKTNVDKITVDKERLTRVKKV